MSTTNGNSPDYDNATKLNAVAENMQTVENVRALERSWIDILMNGRRPYTEEEVKKHQIRINVNFNSGTNILLDANRQVNNATVYIEKYFTTTCTEGPIEKRAEWGQKFTARCKEFLKDGTTGKRHEFLKISRNASLCLHGPGAVVWMTRDGWLPRFVALEDLLIPTDTTIDLCNLQHFCLNLYLTQYEFYELSHGEKSDPGWNKDYVKTILNSLKDPKSDSTYDLNQQPEKWQENFKQNRCYYNSDAVKKVKLRMFFFQGSDMKWYRRVILRETPDTQGKPTDLTSDKFVYTSKVAFADNISQILHIAYGNCSVVPPLKHHSVRGLGTFLYGPVEIENRLMCQSIQATFDDLMQLLRVENPTDRLRQLMAQFFPYGVVENGVSFIKRDERHQPNPQLVQNSLSMTRQKMSENSASFVQDINDGTNKEMTLGEAEIRANAANVMVGGMLTSLYSQEKHYYTEIVRRLCQKNPTNDDIVQFQKDCIADGIPALLVRNPKAWRLSMDKVIGAGDQVLAQQRTSALLGQSQRFDPPSQRIILHDWVAVMTDNPDKAAQLVPIKPPEATDGMMEAEDVFATLMQGLPVSFRDGIDQQGYIESMIGMMSGKIGQLEQQEQGGDTPELDDLIGLDTVQQDINQHIEVFAQNPENKALVKEYGDALGQLNNMLKKFIQHYAEQKQSDDEAANINPEAMAKANATTMLAEVKARISEMNSAQKRQQSALKFQMQMEQKAQSHMQQMQIANEKQMVEMRKQLTELMADLKEQAIRTNADVKAKEAQAAAATKGDDE